MHKNSNRDTRRASYLAAIDGHAANDLGRQQLKKRSTGINVKALAFPKYPAFYSRTFSL